MQREAVYEVPCGHCDSPVGVTAFADHVRKTMDQLADSKGWARLADNEIAYCDECRPWFEAKRDATVAEFRRNDWAGFDHYRDRIRSGMSEQDALAEAPRFLQKDTYFKSRAASFALWWREHAKKKGKDF